MKFRKILPTALALCCFAACNSRPDGVSDEMYNYAESVIRAADAYMDNQLSYEEAYQKIESLNDSAKTLSDEHKDNADYNSDNITHTWIDLVRSGIYLEHWGIQTYADLLEKRNTLAEKIGYPARD